MRESGVYSEVGKLRTVMVCRPSLAHPRLTKEYWPWRDHLDAEGSRCHDRSREDQAQERESYIEGAPDSFRQESFHWPI